MCLDIAMTSLRTGKYCIMQEVKNAQLSPITSLKLCWHTEYGQARPPVKFARHKNNNNLKIKENKITDFNW